MNEHEWKKANRVLAASHALGGLLASGQMEDLTNNMITDLALSHADTLLARIDATSRTRPGDSRTDAMRERQQENIEEHQANRAKERTKPVPAPSTPKIRDLGVSGRACAPLERMDVNTLSDLCLYDRKDISEVKGVSTESLAQLDALLAEHGLAWGMDEEDREAASGPSDGDDGDDDDVEDVL